MKIEVKLINVFAPKICEPILKTLMLFIYAGIIISVGALSRLSGF